MMQNFRCSNKNYAHPARLLLLVLIASITTTVTTAFTVSMIRSHPLLARQSYSALHMVPPEDEPSDSNDNNNDSDLAAAFALFAKQSGVQLTSEDLLDDDDDDDEDDEDEENTIPTDYNDAEFTVSDNASTLTDEKIYSEVRDRVFDTAGGLLEMVKEPSEEDDDNEDDQQFTPTTPKVYTPPSTTTPNHELTAGEVVECVLDALRHLNDPTPLYGMEVLFGYSSETSQIVQEEGLTPAEFTDYLMETEYKVLFQHDGVTIDKGSYSFDGEKAFYTALLKVGPKIQDVVAVNFILSNKGNETDAWLVDSMLIRPESMRRRRRK